MPKVCLPSILFNFYGTRLAVVVSSPWDEGEERLNKKVMQPERCGCAKSAMRSRCVERLDLILVCTCIDAIFV
jgi:hypothetical protein